VTRTQPAFKVIQGHRCNVNTTCIQGNSNVVVVTRTQHVAFLCGEFVVLRLHFRLLLVPIQQVLDIVYLN